MPNWCANRMYFSAEPAQIAEIKRLASGAVTPFYRRATNEGIQLFLAGSAGLLQTTEDVQFEPCPGLTAAGRGVVSPENIAFTRWLTHLQNGVLLDEQNCLMLHELWLQSGTGQRRWEGLPDEVRETITVHFTAKRGDWCGFWSNEDVSVWWNRLCDNVLPEKTMPFDLLTVLPTRLDVEVNGFNGGVLNGVPSAYHWYTEQYGVKWRYSLRWKLPSPCPGEHELVSEVVEAGQPAPASVMSRWVAGAGYAVCLDFISDRQVCRWSEERKAAVRRRNLEKRINRHAPLFADELIARELAERPDYFQGK